MASVGPRRATYDDLLALPRKVVGEIVGGELRTQPRPSGPHAAAASLLGMVLGNPFHGGRKTSAIQYGCRRRFYRNPNASIGSARSDVQRFTAACTRDSSGWCG
jgi:hypothetical protein